MQTSQYKIKSSAHAFNTISFRETNRTIGDLMKVFAPHLKMYGEYVKNFDNAMVFVDMWIARSREFSKMLRDVVLEVGYCFSSFSHAARNDA